MKPLAALAVPRWLLIMLWAVPVLGQVTAEFRYRKHRAWEHHSDAEVRLMCQREDYQEQRDRRSRATSREENVETSCRWTLEKNDQGKIVRAYRQISGPAVTLFEEATSAAKTIFEPRPMTDGTITENEGGLWDSHH